MRAWKVAFHMLNRTWAVNAVVLDVYSQPIGYHLRKSPLQTKLIMVKITEIFFYCFLSHFGHVCISVFGFHPPPPPPTPHQWPKIWPLKVLLRRTLLNMDTGVIEGGLNVTLTIRLLMHGKVCTSLGNWVIVTARGGARKRGQYLGAHQISTVGCLAWTLFSSSVDESVMGKWTDFTGKLHWAGKA